MIGRRRGCSRSISRPTREPGEIVDVTLVSAGPNSMTGAVRQTGRRLMARRDLAAVAANDAGRARLELEFDQPYLLGPLFGDYDRHLITIEQRLGVHIAARGNRVQIEGEADAAARARDVLIGLYNRLDQGQDVDAEAVEAVLGMAAQPNLDGIIQRRGDLGRREVMIRTRKKTIVPRSPVQTVYMEALGRDEMIFALGPAGTGKTYLAVAQAVSQLISGSVDRLILSRPAVEAGERLGFLPGDMKEKVDPYLRPLYDALYDMLPTEQVERRIASRRDRDRADRLHARPHAQRRLHHPRRGAEHHAAADEDVPDPLRHAQPDGDLRRPASGRPARSDASRASPTRSASSSGVKGIAIVRFTAADVVRHPLVGRIVEAYEGPGR